MPAIELPIVILSFHMGLSSALVRCRFRVLRGAVSSLISAQRAAQLTPGSLDHQRPIPLPASAINALTASYIVTMSPVSHATSTSSSYQSEELVLSAQPSQTQTQQPRQEQQTTQKGGLSTQSPCSTHAHGLAQEQPVGSKGKYVLDVEKSMAADSVSAVTTSTTTAGQCYSIICIKF